MKHSGICFTCEDLLNCPMEDKSNSEMMELKRKHPLEKDKNGRIDWCPMHYQIHKGEKNENSV